MRTYDRLFEFNGEFSSVVIEVVHILPSEKKFTVSISIDIDSQSSNTNFYMSVGILGEKQT